MDICILSQDIRRCVQTIVARELIMQQAVPTVSSSCPICRELLANEPTIPTTSGGAVHLPCASAQARKTAGRRAVRAAVSALVMVYLAVVPLASFMIKSVFVQPQAMALG